MRVVLTSGVFLFCASACGGGGGGSTSIPVTHPSSQPSSSPAAVKGDVKTVGKGFSAQPMAYDSDDGALLYPDATGRTVVTGFDPTAPRLLPIFVPKADSGGIVAMQYSSAQKMLYFATQHNIYRAPFSGGVNAVAQNFTEIQSIAVAPDGTVYAIDGDHISKSSAGSAVQITGPNSIPAPYQNGYMPPPGIAFDSKDSNLYLTDPPDGLVKRVTTDGAMSTIAGSCTPIAGTGTNCARFVRSGSGSSATFNVPGQIAYDASNDTLYVTDYGGNVLWAVRTDGNATPVAGYGASADEDGNGVRAMLEAPMRISYAPDTGAVYFSEQSGLLRTYQTSGTTPAAVTSPATAIYPAAFSIGAHRMAAGSDGSVWVAESSLSKVAHVTAVGTISEWPLTGGIVNPWNIALDADGDAWVTAQTGAATTIDGALDEITSTGPQTPYIFVSTLGPLGTTISYVGQGPDGNPWFSEGDSNGFTNGAIGQGYLAKIDRHSGAITRYQHDDGVGPIASGAPSALWFVEQSSTGMAITSATSGGQFGTAFATQRQPMFLVYNPSGAKLWWTDDWQTLVSLSSGQEQDYTICNQCAPFDLAVAPDGTLWVDSPNLRALLHVDQAGNATQYLLPEFSSPSGIAARPDGKVWVADANGVIYLFDPKVYDALQLPHPTGF